MDNRTETELHQANGRFIEMLAHMARHDATPTYDLLRYIYRALNLLDAAGRRRAGERPYLLIDCHFQDEPWWQGLKTLPAKGKPESWTSTFSRRSAVELTRRTLTLAWHTALGTRSPRPCAHLGLSPAVAELLATFSLEELDRVAERHVTMLAPRWARQPQIWNRLLDAAKGEDAQAFHGIDLHAAQLLSHDLMAVMLR